jgi:hypothetical protein
MCSSPKSSTTHRRRAKKIALSRAEYEEYSQMVKRASACYEEAQQPKAERRQKTPIQQPLSIKKPLEVVKYKRKKQPSIFPNIKAFFMRPVMLKRV